MKTTLASILGLFFLTSSIAFAHGPDGHAHGPAIKEAKAQQIAKKVVQDLIDRKTLVTEWNEIVPKKPTQKSFGHGNEWVVTFFNAKAKPGKTPKGKVLIRTTLYVFISMQGKVLGSNFIGN